MLHDAFDSKEDALGGAKKLLKEYEDLVYHFDADIEAPELLEEYKATVEALEDLLNQEEK